MQPTIENLTTTTYEDCDWDEEACPVCGRDQGDHDSRAITACAIYARN